MRATLKPPVLLLSIAAACAPLSSPPGAPTRRPLPGVTLEQCGPAPDAGTIYLEEQVTGQPSLKQAGNIDYPRDLQVERIGGDVRIAFVIDPSGKPVESSLRTLHATRSGFVDAARGLVLTSQFIPALLDGHAVAVCTAQIIHFTP